MLARPDRQKNEREYRYRQILPDGKAVLYTVIPMSGGIDAAHVAVRSLVNGESKVLVEGGADATYAPTGHLVYRRAGALLVVAFDVTRRWVAYQSSPHLMAVRVLDASANFRFEAPRSLLNGGFVASSAGTPRTYDAATEGRLLMIESIITETGRRLFVLVQNWFEELRQKGPTP